MLNESEMPPILAVALAVMALGVAGTSGVVAAINDYPTAARADYVFGCMAANGQTREYLQRCVFHRCYRVYLSL